MMLFEKEYELRGADFDGFDRLRPSSVLALFQDVAGLHAIELGVGFDALMARREIWVLTKVRYTLLQSPRRYDRVRVRTWPLVPGRVNFRREYAVESLDGRLLIQGTSEWVVVHSEKRRVLPAGNIYPAGEDYCERTFYPGRLAKVPPLEEAEESRTVVPGFTQLDINGHVNNTCYADYVLDALAPQQGWLIRDLQIDYHRELLQGMAFTLQWRQQDRVALFRGLSGAGECMFSCRAELDRT